MDRLISVFMRSLQKMVREHLSPQPNPGAAETSTGDHSLDSWVKDVFPPKINLKLFYLKSLDWSIIIRGEASLIVLFLFCICVYGSP
ncbi:MAG: hypothetical protein ACRCWR_01615 [Saezia sp.]